MSDEGVVEVVAEVVAGDVTVPTLLDLEPEPGPMFDLALALHVFGGTWNALGAEERAYEPQATHWLQRGGRGEILADLRAGVVTLRGGANYLQYSTTDLGALRVIDRMAHHGLFANVRTPEVPGGPYAVGFHPHGEAQRGGGDRPSRSRNVKHRGKASTLPMATALAAWSWVLSEHAHVCDQEPVSPAVSMTCDGIDTAKDKM